jgi:hypothetical protein
MLKMPLYGISLFYLPLSAVAGVALRLDRGRTPAGDSRLPTLGSHGPALSGSWYGEGGIAVLSLF